MEYLKMDIKSQLEALNDCDLYDVYLKYCDVANDKNCDVHLMLDELDDVMRDNNIDYIQFYSLTRYTDNFDTGDTFFKYDGEDLFSSNDLFDLLNDEENFIKCISEHQKEFEPWIDFKSELKEKITDKLSDLTMEQLEQLSKIIDTY